MDLLQAVSMATIFHETARMESLVWNLCSKKRKKKKHRTDY